MLNHRWATVYSPNWALYLGLHLLLQPSKQEALTQRGFQHWNSTGLMPQVFWESRLDYPLQRGDRL